MWIARKKSELQLARKKCELLRKSLNCEKKMTKKVMIWERKKNVNCEKKNIIREKNANCKKKCGQNSEKVAPEKKKIFEEKS